MCWASRAGKSGGSPICCVTSARAAAGVLSNDFARTLRDDRWQSIILGIGGVLAGLGASLFVVRRTVRPLKAIAKSIRMLAAGEKSASIPATDMHNEIGDIARAAEVFRRSLVDADTAREAAIHAPWPSSASRKKATANCSKVRSTESM